MRAILAIHGIRTRSLNWADIFRVYFHKDERTTDDIFYEFYYGYIPAILSIFPPVRRRIANKLNYKIQEIEKENPGVEISLVAHSLGTLISYYVATVFKHRIGKMIFLASVVPIGVDLASLLNNNVGKLVNYHSEKDNVARFNPYGHSGAWGFGLKHERLVQKKYSMKHSEWFSEDPPNFYELILGDIYEDTF